MVTHDREPSISLPEPDRTGTTAVETALAERRSRREFAEGPISLSAVGQLLWAAQGETDADGHRAAPSAGATYPMALRLLVAEGGVPDLDPGIYRYRPATHDLVAESDRQIQSTLRDAAGDQEWLETAPIVVAITGVAEPTEAEFGARAERYLPIEAGHVGQNLHLQVEALGLATVTVGGFDDERATAALDLEDAEPFVFYPIGQRV
jgi:SagB-type dehydrogenase family enzyme